MFGIKKIGTSVMASTCLVVILTLISMGIGQYVSETSLREQQIVEKSIIALMPIISLAEKNIAGGNVMTLKNKAANDLYSASSSLLFLKLAGTSSGNPKTEVSEEIPPLPIEHIYKSESVGKAGITIIERDLGDQETLLDREKKLLYISKKLDLKNGGRAYAVFSAKELEGVGLKVLGGILPVAISVLIGALLIAVVVGRRITAPIAEATDQIRKITHSLNLSSRVVVKTKGEIGELSENFNGFISRVQEMVRDIIEHADNVRSLSVTFSTESGKVLKMVNEQCSEMERVASSVEQSTATGMEIASSSEMAANSGKTIKGAVKSGSEVVINAINGMTGIAGEAATTSDMIEELGKRSEHIEEIISVINDIADQTNLLALNAAIEAARAGEHGRGFAVVADEVRKLAEKTTKATKETASMVAGIQSGTKSAVTAMNSGKKNIDIVVGHARHAGDRLDEINKHVSEITDKITMVATAMNQQSVATSEIAESTERVCDSSKKIKEEIALITESARQLSGISEGLKEKVGHFII